MEETTVVIKIKEGDPLLVSKQRLTSDSRIFRNLIDECNFEEIDMSDFSTAAVTLFLTILEDKNLGEIRDDMFRELHKMAVVFEVMWLKNDCHRWLRSKMSLATEDHVKSFLFDECWYMLQKWEDRDAMEALISCLSPKNNSSFISKYMSDLRKLELKQIDMMLRLGGGDSDVFLSVMLYNLVRKKDMSDKLQHLLRKMDLALCCERNEKLYLEVFDTISNLSEISNANLKFIYNLTSGTIREMSSRKRKLKQGTTVVREWKKYGDLLDICKTLNDIIKSVNEDCVKSMYEVVDILLKVCHVKTPNEEERQTFITTLENIFTDPGNKMLQKISKEYLDILTDALDYSNLEQSDQLITLLNEIKSNDKLTTCHQNVIIKRDKYITVTEDKEWKDLYTFKHPGTGTCTETGKCGFILSDGKITLELCTNSEDYTDTGVHFHDIISAHDMLMYYYTSSVHTAAGNVVTVVGVWKWEEIWLPDITDWEFAERHITYNVADYMVAK